MGLGAKDVRLSESAAGSLEALENNPDPSAATIARRVRSYRSILLEDCLHGEAVRKSRVPKGLAQKYGLENLYVEDLPSFWRLLYTIVRVRGERVVIVIEVVDDKAYSKRFPGRR